MLITASTFIFCDIVLLQDIILKKLSKILFLLESVGIKKNQKTHSVRNSQGRCHLINDM